MQVEVIPRPTDEEIASRVQSGDLEGFGMLVDRYERKLYRYGAKFLSRTEDIEDIVQDILISAYRNIQSFDSSQRFSPWIYRVAHNAFVNALRQNKRGPVFMDFDTLISHQVYEDPHESEREQKDMRALLDRGLEYLQPKYKEVLVLHYFEDMPYKDIAEVLQVPLGTVSIRIRRAKELLREQIKNQI